MALWRLAIAIALCISEGASPLGISPLIHTIGIIETKIMINSEMIREFLLIARGVPLPEIKNNLLHSIDKFEAGFANLVSGDEHQGVVAPPSDHVQSKFADLLDEWPTYKALLVDNYESVNVQSTDILESVHHTSKYIGDELRELEKMYTGFARMQDVPLQPSYALVRKQITNIEIIMKAGLFQTLAIDSEYYDTQLRTTEQFFEEAHLSLAKGNTLAGIPATTSICALHKLAEVDGYWEAFQQQVRKLRKPIQRDISLKEQMLFRLKLKKLQKLVALKRKELRNLSVEDEQTGDDQDGQADDEDEVDREEVESEDGLVKPNAASDLDNMYFVRLEENRSKLERAMEEASELYQLDPGECDAGDKTVADLKQFIIEANKERIHQDKLLDMEERSAAYMKMPSREDLKSAIGTLFDATPESVSAASEKSVRALPRADL